MSSEELSGKELATVLVNTVTMRIGLLGEIARQVEDPEAHRRFSLVSLSLGMLPAIFERGLELEYEARLGKLLMEFCKEFGVTSDVIDKTTNDYPTS
jgi:hypothetical protein